MHLYSVLIHPFLCLMQSEYEKNRKVHGILNKHFYYILLLLLDLCQYLFVKSNIESLMHTKIFFILCRKMDITYLTTLYNLLHNLCIDSLL